MSSDVECTVAEFGDPIPARTKFCFSRDPVDTDDEDDDDDDDDEENDDNDEDDDEEESFDFQITVDVNDEKQQIGFMGSDMERSAFAFLANSGNGQQIADWYNWVFKDSAFEYCRVSYDKNQELVEGSPNFSFYDDSIESMQLVQNSNGNTKFVATLRSDYDGFGTENNLPDWIYSGEGYNGGSYDPALLLDTAKYTRFLCDYLQLHSDNGVEISILAVVKEWSSVVNTENEKAVITEIKRLLTTDEYQGTPEPDFIGPSTHGVAAGISFVEQAGSIVSIDEYIGISVHGYTRNNQATRGELIAEADQERMPVWHTESGHGGAGRTNGAEVPMSQIVGLYETRCIWYSAGLHGELFFEPWSRGVNSETRPIYFTNGSSGVRLRAYYVMQQFGNLVADSNYVTPNPDGLNGVTTMAFRRANEVALWVINSSNTAYDGVRIQLDGGEGISGNVNRLMWDESTSIESSSGSATVSSDGDAILDDISGVSISTTYVFSV